MKRQPPKISKKRCTITGIITTIPLIAYILAKINQVRWIQSIGYRATNNLTRIFLALTILCLAEIFSYIVVYYIKKSKYNKLQLEQELQISQSIENQRIEQAQLSVNGKLSDKIIYNRLQTHTTNWQQLTNTNIPKYINTILKQLTAMNSYQDKLSKILVSNGSNLTETLDVFDNAEQDILRKVRKILNCADVYDTDNSKDIEIMIELLKDTVDTNEKQLTVVKDCLLATTDYLNKQGDSNRGLEQLNLYMNVIKEQINDE